MNYHAPKDLARIQRATSKLVDKLTKSVELNNSFPRWSPDPELVKKYNLIEFL